MARGRHERLADTAAGLGPDRDVLEIGVGRRQAPRRRDRLVIGRVDAAGSRVDLQGQFVGVGALQFADAAILEDDPRQVIVVREFLEDVLRR